jgi:cytochrome oxidase Cu insertion factor (SCO1/SenC/PrrC family)
LYRQRPPRSTAQRLAIAVVAALTLALGYYLGNRFAGPSVPRTPQALITAPEPVQVAELGLTDYYGQPFGAEQLAGRWSLFALAHPTDAEQMRTALTRLVLVHNRLVDQPAVQGKFRGLVVALDPVADPRTLRDSVDIDSPDFLGLSGDAEAVARLAPEGSTDDPARSLALADPQGNVVGWFTGDTAPATIAGDIKSLARTRPAD